MTLWDGYDAVAFYAVRNGEGQYSVWPQHRELPVGWDPVAGPAPRAQCLAEIEARWTDMRPASVVAGPRGPDGRGADGRAASGSTDEVVRPDVLSALYGYHVDVLNVHGRVIVVAGPGLDAGVPLPVDPSHDVS